MKRMLLPLALLLVLPGQVWAEELYELSGRTATGHRFTATIRVTERPAALVTRRTERGYLVTQEGGGLDVERRVTWTADGKTEVQRGQGRRASNGLEAWFDVQPGASGVLAGQTQQVLTLSMIVERDGSCRASCQIGRLLRSSSRGKRVTPNRSAEERTRPAQPAPAQKGPPAGQPSLAGTKAQGYARIIGVPFLKGEGDRDEIEYGDVRQGELGSCYLLASLVSIAKNDPRRIRERIRTLGDGRYQVRLGPRTAPITVDDWFPFRTRGRVSYPAFASFGDQDTSRGWQKVRHELWPMLFEKAYAKRAGGYAQIDGGHSGIVLKILTGASDLKALEKEEALRLAFGRLELPRRSVWFVNPRRVLGSTVIELLRRAQREKLIVVIGTKPFFPKEDAKLVAATGLQVKHAYAFAKVEGARVWLYNPWAREHPKRALTGEEVRKLCAGITLARF